MAHSFGLGQLGDGCSVHGVTFSSGSRVRYPYDLEGKPSIGETWVIIEHDSTIINRSNSQDFVPAAMQLARRVFSLSISDRRNSRNGASMIYSCSAEMETSGVAFCCAYGEIHCFSFVREGARLKKTLGSNAAVA